MLYREISCHHGRQKKKLRLWEKKENEENTPALRDAKDSLLHSQSEDWRTKRERLLLTIVSQHGGEQKSTKDGARERICVLKCI